MMTQNADKKREQVQFLCMDDMVPSPTKSCFTRLD